jgi:hypothetical protein
MLSSIVQRFVTERLDAFLDHGPMFGDHGAIELGIIMLLEFELITNFPGIWESNKRAAIEAYLVEARTRYPRIGPLMLSAVATDFPKDSHAIAMAARRRLGLLP